MLNANLETSINSESIVLLAISIVAAAALIILFIKISK